MLKNITMIIKYYVYKNHSKIKLSQVTSDFINVDFNGRIYIRKLL